MLYNAQITFICVTQMEMLNPLVKEAKDMYSSIRRMNIRQVTHFMLVSRLKIVAESHQHNHKVYVC